MQPVIQRSSIPPADDRRGRTKVYGGVLVGSLVLLAVGLGVRGADFYVQDVQARVDHPDFRVLSPAGPVGHGYGIVGTALMFTNLLYLLRRRFARWRMGSMQTWLHIHVATGLLGTVLVVYHSAFQLRTGIASVTAISLACVVLSGLVGRYFYAISPTADEARLEVALQDMRTLWPSLGAQLTSTVAALPPPVEVARPTLLATLARIPSWWRQARDRRRTIHGIANAAMSSVSLSPHQRALVQRRVRRISRVCVDQVKGAAGAYLLRTWRSLHRLMALLMLTSVTVHIAVAWYFGFGWGLTE